ncbi:MAG: tetraacyldisaccharide 4'-kinase [Rhizobiaceae bacterium]|jgi:tetraacyldisaccharide 4'-kinase|nr:tetraacyldisaccharide 4'-kinase [Rhizobiaceae bacterium]
MFGSAPAFWHQKAGWKALALAPFAALYGKVALERLNRVSPRPPVPVVCVGNYTLGGSGKTPVAIALAQIARAEGFKPGFLSRGHGGSNRTVRLIDADVETAASAGDEPLLLAEYAPVAAGADRLAAAALLVQAGCDFAIMDDGFQSRRLEPSFSLLVIDARYGLGNGKVFPAGPLRAPLSGQLLKTDALAVVGEGQGADGVIRLAARAAKPVIPVVLKPQGARRWKGVQAYAFSGIGHPEKFFRTVEGIGAKLVGRRPFPDHHPFTEADALTILAEARALDAQIVTTEKDAIRLAGAEGARGRLAAQLQILPVRAETTLDQAFERIIREAASRHAASR